MERLCFCSDDHCENSTCVLTPRAKCFHHTEELYNDVDKRMETHSVFGCLPVEADASMMQCKGHLAPHETPKSIDCCDEYDFCNLYLDPSRPPSGTIHPESGSGAFTNLTPIVCALLAGIVLFAAIILAVCMVWYRRRIKQKIAEKKIFFVNSETDPTMEGLLHDNTTLLRDMIERSSGSGSGLPLLVQRTIARQLQMIRSVGKGRYGEVWKAHWRGETVAVKIFLTTEEKSWFRETEIYQTVMLRHENVLGFIAADIKGTGSCTQMLLVTDFIEHGSLHDFLKCHPLSIEQTLSLASTAAAGLAHLHSEIHGTRGKPAIAHRDIKSKNILVKRGFVSVIADFGLAVRFDSNVGTVDIAANSRVGTKRYMAPEVLNEKLNHQNFEAFKMADMYSFGLVLWEIISRCIYGDTCDEYKVPFQEFVPIDPSFEEMKRVVCVDNVRPLIAERLNQDPTLRVFIQRINECWHAQPEVRLTALRLKKDLSLLLQDVQVLPAVQPVHQPNSFELPWSPTFSTTAERSPASFEV